MKRCRKVESKVTFFISLLGFGLVSTWHRNWQTLLPELHVLCWNLVIRKRSDWMFKKSKSLLRTKHLHLRAAYILQRMKLAIVWHTRPGLFHAVLLEENEHQDADLLFFFWVFRHQQTSDQQCIVTLTLMNENTFYFTECTESIC